MQKSIRVTAESALTHAEKAAPEYSHPPPIFAEFPSLQFQSPGVWVWRNWIMPTRATLSAYRALMLKKAITNRNQNFGDEKT